MLSRNSLKYNTYKAAVRFYSAGTIQNQGTGASTTQMPTSAQLDHQNVSGLSSACVHPATEPVGPGVEPNKSGAYKAPEYFCYDSTTFYEAEVEMSKFRCQQPSALKKIK